MWDDPARLDGDEKRRMMAFLQRRGFDFDTIRKAVKRL